MNHKNKGEATKQHIIDNAISLFTKNGYNHTSLSQLLNVTGLTKGGFYFHFKSKEDLGIEVIKHLENCWTKEILPKMLAGKNAKEKLETMLTTPGDCSSQRKFRPAILLLILATEMIEVNDKFSKMIRQIFMGWWLMVETIIEEGKIEKIFVQNIDTQAVAAIILSNILGANLLAIINGNSDIYYKQLNSLKTVLFDGIANKSFNNRRLNLRIK